MITTDRFLLVLVFLFTLLHNSAHALVILQYHHIADDTPFSTSTKPEVFAAHLEHLAQSGFNIVSLSEHFSQQNEGDASANALEVAITFDDAYRSIFTEAFPLLRARGWPFTIFVATDLVGRPGGHYLAWDELKAMKAAGAEIANHSTGHQHWARKPVNKSLQAWSDEFLQDTLRAQETLETHLDFAPKHYALPYGEYHPLLVDQLQAAGFIIFGQHSGAVSRPRPVVIPRFPMGGPYAGLESFKTKVLTRAFPGVPKLHNPILTGLETKPMINTTALGLVNPSGLNCFGPNGAIMPAREHGSILIQATAPLQPGRARYNCTQMSDQSGRFYWHSYFWMKQHSDNTWYAEP